MTEQYYLHLFHARKTASEPAAGLDYVGPLFKLAGAVRVTYGRCIRFQEGVKGVPAYSHPTKDCMLCVVGDCVYYDGVYYGEWCVRTAEGMTPGSSDFPIFQFDAAKASPPRATFVVDPVPDANGGWTIRPGDGSPNGNTGVQPVATFYNFSLAEQAAMLMSAELLGPVSDTKPAATLSSFSVTVRRSAARVAKLTVKAESEEEAKTAALDRAGDVDFSNGKEESPEYDVADVKLCEVPVVSGEDKSAAKARIRPPGSWVNTRGLDAETLVEVSSMMFGDGLAAYFETQAERLDLVYGVARSFQEAHANTCWEEHGDYWGVLEEHCAEAMANLRKHHKPSRAALLPEGCGPGEYAITVRFDRSLLDDLDVLSHNKDCSGSIEDRLRAQFVKELQEAYDNNNIADSFVVQKVHLPPAEERYTQEEWRAEVAAGDTRLGYDEWLSHKLEQEGR